MIYLNANIVNVGEMGTALSLLVAYFSISGLLIIYLCMQKGIVFRFHFFVFLLLMCWIVIRVWIDFFGWEEIKSITIGTTGGILTFYLAGVFLNIGIVQLQESPWRKFIRAITLLVIFILSCYLFISLISQLRDDIYLISDFNDDYQRSGNFLSISFVAASIVLISMVSDRIGTDAKKIKLLFWYVIYVIIAMTSLSSSQLFGSNSATAVIAGVYILTTVTFLLMLDNKLYRLYDEGRLALPFGVKIIKKYFRLIVGLVVLNIALLFAVLLTSNFDIKNIRMLGFDSGSSSLTSLTSRFDILNETGIDQIMYAPLLGNMNVAHLVTGDSGKTLHSFFPFIFANLGLVGFSVALYYFILIFWQLRKECRLSPNGRGSFEFVLTKLYFISILLFIILFANLTVGVSWIVIWFVVGFISQPFRFKSNYH